MAWWSVTLCFERKFGIDGIIFNPLGPTIDSDLDWYKKTDLWFDDLSEINKILDQLIELKKKGAKILNPPEQFESDIRRPGNPKINGS